MECHGCKMQSTSGTSKLHLCVELLSGTSIHILLLLECQKDAADLTG